MCADRRSFALLLSAALAAGCHAPVRAPDPGFPATPSPATAAPPATVSNAPVTAVPLRVPTPVARSRSGGEILARVVSRFADPPCVADRVVHRWEQNYSRWPPRFAANIERALPLIELVNEELELFGLPGEFALLPIVESWYRPDAGRRSAGAGIWQFGSATGRGSGLRVDPAFDERFAPAAATRAAALHLSRLQNRFGDWKLASMAFNAGEYRLARALERSGAGDSGPRASAQSHRPQALALGTYEHLAKVQALACLIAQPGRFGIVLPLAATIDPLVLVPVDADIASLDEIADLAGMPREQLAALNPAFPARPLGPRTPRLALLPQGAAHRLALRDRTESAAPSVAGAGLPRRVYLVRSGDTLGAIAARFGLRLTDLLRWNRLDPGALLHPGQEIGLAPEAR